MAHQRNHKKVALLALKDEILNDIKYFEKRIEDARSQKTNSNYFDDDDEDSDSDIFPLDMMKSLPDLKLEQELLQTCVHATQELTNLCVLQSEVNVLVNDPVYEREPTVIEQGTWREVTADCRMDLVPFSITFYAHQASRLFGPTSYRGLRVMPVKAAHENELAKSILPRVSTPSDAIEVLRSYSFAHRSRRTTLARLAEKYSNSLFMEPMAEGGYVIKCGKLLEVSWTLENKWSPIAPFHHKMKFDLDYMDEVYVKIISQAHRELSDPTLETDERTRLMSKIIATCLEAQGPNQELYESMESDVEPENLRKRRTTLDEEIEQPVNKKKMDSEIMAPPKSLPKKTKPKGKENNADNKKDSKGGKRSVTEDGAIAAKKARLQDAGTNHNDNTKQKDNKEVVALKKVSNNKLSNVREDDVSKKNVDKEVIKTVPDKEKKVGNKKSNKENFAKNIDAKLASSKHPDNANIILKPASASKAVKNNVVSKESGENNTQRVKNGTKKPRDVTEGVASENNNELNLNDKAINERNVLKADELGKMGDTKKISKKSDKVLNAGAQTSNKTNNKQEKINKASKNLQGTNFTESTEVRKNKAHNIERLSENNNEKPTKTKVQANVATKDGNPNSKTSDKKRLKAQSTGNVNENVASTADLNVDNNTKKNIIKSKSLEKQISKPIRSDPGNSNTKNNPISIKNNTAKSNNAKDGRNMKTVSSDKNMEINSKGSLNDNVSKFPSAKNANENVVTQHITKSSNKQLQERLINKQIIENPKTSAVSNKSSKSNVNMQKKENERKNAVTKSKQDVTQLKVVVKNINAKSKNIDNIIDKIDKNVATENSNSYNGNELINENVANVNEVLSSDLNEGNSGKISENVNYNSMKLKKSTEEPNLNINNNNFNNLKKINLNVKKNTQNKNVVGSKNGIPSKSPIHKNKMKLLNPRNKISIDKFKVSSSRQNGDIQKDNHDKNKIVTKIPQKLMSVREQVIKKNPLRISPRKINSNFKTDSQNSSRSSLRSLQKPMTGIPRLMKKPIRKG